MKSEPAAGSIPTVVPCGSDCGTMRAELIGHFEPCMTEIYLHIYARMADDIRTHPYALNFPLTLQIVGAGVGGGDLVAPPEQGFSRIPIIGYMCLYDACGINRPF